MKTPNNAAANFFPLPGVEALAHSNACAAMLRNEIRRSGGWLSFSAYMAKALYAPALGYYAAGTQKFGQAGDFTTAPEISPLFGECIARSVAGTVRDARLLELGPGSGKLACDILRVLEKIDALPTKYFLLEVSADLRARQQEKLSSLPPHLFALCAWIDELPTNFIGAIIANEVLDVVPVHLVTFKNGLIFERGVALSNNGEDAFVWQDVPGLPDDVQKMVDAANHGQPKHAWPDGYLTEFAPQASALSASIMNALGEGVILLIDYGFRRSEFYHPSRHTGTLMCHYRHYAHTDPFLYPGLQDITTHVDFTAIAEAGVEAGGELIGYTTQANFLLGAGITEAIGLHDPANTVSYLAVTNQAQRLLSPAEMGEFFKVIGFSKGGHTIAALADARPLPL